MKTTMFFTVIFCVAMAFAISIRSTDVQCYWGTVLVVVIFGINTAKLLVFQAKELDQK